MIYGMIKIAWIAALTITYLICGAAIFIYALLCEVIKRNRLGEI